MDGQNVNKCFQQKLKIDLKNQEKRLIDVGTCPLHTISNASLEGLKSLLCEVDLNAFAVNLHSFFKFSAKRITDFFELEKETELHAQKMIRHVVTRWISIQIVLVRILEQFKNIETYFLTTLPSQKGFNYKSGVGNSERYKNIKVVLLNKKLQSIMAAVSYFAQDFKIFILPLQAAKPMIPVLHHKFRRLLQGHFSKFLKEDALLKDNKLISIKKIPEINLSDEKKIKVMEVD